ncbi:hypothetical protein MACK_003121 [Theileria orientalis]|uniref:Uncharacterized protein n=1 Tax=Theileria orientalis TaxID=68886 RepID=A0A976QXK4_THEOR|nr:hypothetical protein MACK_003121 [Theileria orientalis]
MDSSENTLNENEPIPEAPPSELNNFINKDENSSDLKDSAEIDYSTIQDIEFGSKVLLFFDYFTDLKEFFQLSTSDFSDSANAARRGSDDTIHVNLDIPNEENEWVQLFQGDSVAASVQMVQDSLFYDSVS